MPSVQSFPPELMAALLQGAKEPLTVGMPYRIAVRFRQQLYRLRAAMKEEKHLQYNLVSRVAITITWAPDVLTSKSSRNVPFPTDRQALVQVNLTPTNAEYAEALKAAGLDMDVDIDLDEVAAGGDDKPDLSKLLKDIKP